MADEEREKKRALELERVVLWIASSEPAGERRRRYRGWSWDLTRGCAGCDYERCLRPPPFSWDRIRLWLARKALDWGRETEEEVTDKGLEIVHELTKRDHCCYIDDGEVSSAIKDCDS